MGCNNSKPKEYPSRRMFTHKKIIYIFRELALYFCDLCFYFCELHGPSNVR